jgi:hypothetical protein
MAHPSKLNSHTGLAFMLGIIVVIAGLAGYVLLAGDGDLSLSVEGEDTAIEKAAEAVSDS